MPTVMKQTTIVWVDKNNQGKGVHRSEVQELKKMEPLYGITVELETHRRDRFNPKVDYVVICSSELYQEQMEAVKKLYNILGTLVYCQKVKANKKLEQDPNVVLVTNTFDQIIKKILLLINEPFFSSEKVRGVQQDQESRFVVGSQTNQTPEFSISAEYLKRKRQILQLFRIDFDVQQDLTVTKKRLRTQLQKYFQSKNLLLLQKQLSKIDSSMTMEGLIKTCIFFYSLEKSKLYNSLNLILKNIRMIKFQVEFQKLKLFAFLLMLNCFFFYSDTEYISEVYRYTDFVPSQDLQGSVITVCNFYSTSKKDSLENFRSKKTKIIVETFDHSRRDQSLCFFNYFLAQKHSAFKNEEEVIFAPFTRFLVQAIKPGKQVEVRLKQLGDNEFLAKIYDINLLQKNQQEPLKFSREINYHSKYQKMVKSQNPQSPSLVKIYLNLGALYVAHLELKWALHYFNRALEITSKLPDRPFRVQICNNIGLVQFKLANFAQALTWYEEALACCDPSNHRTLVSILNNKASALQSLNRFQESKLQYEKTLDLCREVYPQHHIMTATILNNIGFIQQQTLEFKESIQNFQKAIKIYDYIQGQQSGKSSLCYENIAHSYLGMGQFVEAKENLLKAVSLELASKGEYSPNLETQYCTLGSMHNKRQEYQQARKWYCLALKVSQKANGYNHQVTAVLHSNIGSIDISLGLAEEGVVHLQKALDILYSIYKDKNHNLIDTISNNLQNLKTKMKEGFFQ